MKKIAGTGLLKAFLDADDALHDWGAAQFVEHADDELILALASSYIVTHNRDDFRDVGCFGLGVLTPGEFLKIL